MHYINEDEKKVLFNIQRDLFYIGSELATKNTEKLNKVVTDNDIKNLENIIFNILKTVIYCCANIITLIFQWTKTRRRSFFHNFLEEFKSLRALSMKLAAMGPPENSLIIHICLAMSRICTSAECFPETSCHFFSADISPAVLDISLVSDLIQNYRFFIADTPFIYHLRGFIEILSLDAAVSDPWSCVIIEALAVVVAVGVITAVVSKKKKNGDNK